LIHDYQTASKHLIERTIWVDLEVHGRISCTSKRCDEDTEVAHQRSEQMYINYL